MSERREKADMQDLFRSDILDKESAIPLYYQLYAYIENLIQTNQLKEGERLPPEDELVTILGISRPTIRQAYKELSVKGLIQRKRSKGTVVTKPKILNKFLSELTNFYNELSEGSTEISTKVLTLEISSDPEAQDVLKEKRLIHLLRVRYSDGIPVVYIDTYVPYKSYEKLMEYDFEKESLYEKMTSIGRPVVSVRRIIKAEKASAEIAGYLEMNADDPVLTSQTTGRDQNDQPVEYSIARYNSSVAHFQIDLKI